MKGSMREKRPGYWGLRVFEGADPLTGKKGYRTTTFRGTKRQAQSALAGMVTEVDGGVVEPRKCSVAELLAAWLEHIEHVGRPGRPSSVTAGWCASSQTGSTRCRWAGVTPKVVDDLYRLRSKPASRKPATVLRFHTALRAAFAQAENAIVFRILGRCGSGLAHDFRCRALGLARTQSGGPGAVAEPEEPIPPNRVGPGLGRLPRIGRGGPPARPAPPPGVAAPRRRRGDHDGVRPARPPGHVDDPAHLQPPHARRRRPGAEIIRKAFAQPVKPEDPEPEGS